MKRYLPLVFEGVEIWEFDVETGAAECVYPPGKFGTLVPAGDL